MYHAKSLLKASGLLCLVLLFFSLVRAGAPPPAPPALTGQQVALAPYFSYFEDATGLVSADHLYHHPEDFGTGRQGTPTSYYWLRIPLHLDSLADPVEVLSFSSLTYVDVYLYADNALVSHRLAGAFRPRSMLHEGDGRLFTTLLLQPGKTYTLLLEVHHTKHYQPVFDFVIQGGHRFFTAFRWKEFLDAALMGAVLIFFIYTLISWIVSRFRPYAWLLLFIGGIGLYVIGSGGYWIEWVSPEDPAAGWLLNKQFVHIGMLGMYYLVTDFWRFRTDFPRLYAWTRWIPPGLITLSIVILWMDYLTGNYRLSSIIHFCEHPFMTGFIVASIYTCWHRLSLSQRYLAYGLIVCGFTGVLVTLNALVHHEQSLGITGTIGDIMILSTVLLFSTGLKEEMRHHEIAKLAAMSELNRLQQHQNAILEKMVAERTEELAISNKRLIKQKHLLGERNGKIETLINELNHRVKNNLQLLYSLLSLQLPIVKDNASRDILQGNIGKIRAMMLVNQKLFNFEKGDGVRLCEFIAELAAHLQKIYDSREKTRIQLEIPANLCLNDRHTLSFGLILSELFTNTFKHAFRDHPDPCIRVTAASVNAHTLECVYSDNGTGIALEEAGERFSMGIPLIKDLTRQMNGNMTVNDEEGLSYCFHIPV